jgi:uncharacterized protein
MEVAMRYLIAVFLLIGFLAPVRAQTPDEVGRRIDAGDCAGLLAVVSPRAQTGDAVAEFQLGAMYHNGCGVPKDVALAARWYVLAARQNHPVAARTMGIFAEIGFGNVPKDMAAAVIWYKTAIDAGDTWAMVQLGRIYHEGEGGVPVDEVAALALWRRAADRGDGDAMYELGMLYLSGSKLVTRDLRVARNWLENASNAGHINAKYELAIMYRDGEGGSRDFQREATLLQEASRRGHADAMNELGVMYQRGSQGLPRNINMALQMYRLAAAAGSKLGAQNLRDLVADLQRPQPTYTNGGGGGGYNPVVSP